MPKELERLNIEPQSELANALRAASRTGEPLLINIGEATLVVRVAEREVTGLGETPAIERPLPDPKVVDRARRGIRKTAGSWKGLVDPESFRAYIYERRHTANRPPINMDAWVPT